MRITRNSKGREEGGSDLEAREKKKIGIVL